VKPLNPFYDNGRPRFKGGFEQEQMHGYWEFFRKDGSLMRSGNFDLGRQVGIWTTYDRQGQAHRQKDFGV
jgi:antitoxin component YwqK of YwqJK toxin-antitoxin module